MAYYDINTILGSGNASLVLKDANAIRNSLNNIFSCMVGERGRAFQPSYGSNIPKLLQEPICPAVSNLVQLETVQSVKKWEPRLNIAAATVTPVYELPGYTVIIEGTFNSSQFVATTTLAQ